MGVYMIGVEEAFFSSEHHSQPVVECQLHESRVDLSTKSTMYIPKIIHRIWFVFDPKKPQISEQYRFFDENLKKLHHDWTIMEWDEDRADKFVKKNFPNFYNTYASYDIAIKRHDAFRYLLLDYYGGVFVQHSINMSKNVEPLVCGKELVLFPEHELSPYYHNGFMASIPHHNFWKNFTAEYLVPRKNQFVIDSTGPAVFTEAIKKYLPNENNTYSSIFAHKKGLMFPFYWTDRSKPEIAEKCLVGDGSRCFELFPESYGYTVWSASWNKQASWNK